MVHTRLRGKIPHNIVLHYHLSLVDFLQYPPPWRRLKGNQRPTMKNLFDEEDDLESVGRLG